MTNECLETLPALELRIKANKCLVFKGLDISHRVISSFELFIRNLGMGRLLCMKSNEGAKKRFLLFCIHQ